jgi:type VI secretion system secreted protein Hcp
MALNAYLRLRGERQGEIKGSVTQAGREDSIMVIGANHELMVPTDPASGLPSGKRSHTPFIITKEVDRSSPLLYRALMDNENIYEWRLEFWQPSPSGQEVQFYTVELVDASISDIRFEMLNNKYPENMQHKEREHISFCYKQIRWIWMEGGIEAEDYWEAPAR